MSIEDSSVTRPNLLKKIVLGSWIGTLLHVTPPMLFHLTGMWSLILQ